MWRFINTSLSRMISNRFHRLYYASGVFYSTFWLGAQVLKCPFDLWTYQEIVYDLRPDVIVETGTLHGGSALFLASVCDLVNHGEILTIDIKENNDRPQHKRIQYLCGSSVHEETVEKIRSLIGDGESVMVILDSDHHREHVLHELRLYSELVTIGSYVIVEDTNINGHPVLPDFGPGPMEAVEEFMRECDSFVIDKTREKFHLTFNPNGYLKRIR
jgi:cephalosporin hydroxylase